MSKTKFNGFERWFIQTALKETIEQAEKGIKKTEDNPNGKRSVYAPGFFTMIGNELIAKVNSMTLKKDQE